MRLASIIICVMALLAVGATLITLGSEVKAREAARQERIAELTKE